MNLRDSFDLKIQSFHLHYILIVYIPPCGKVTVCVEFTVFISSYSMGWRLPAIIVDTVKVFKVEVCGSGCHLTSKGVNEVQVLGMAKEVLMIVLN